LGAKEVFQFDLEMNTNIYCMHFIIREDYWRQQLFVFSKNNPNKQAHTHTGEGRKLP
jgi:hypothetical protein